MRFLAVGIVSEDRLHALEAIRSAAIFRRRLAARTYADNAGGGFSALFLAGELNLPVVAKVIDPVELFRMGKDLLDLHQFFINWRTIPIIIVMSTSDYHGIIVLKAAAEFMEMVVEPAEGPDKLAMELCERCIVGAAESSPDERL